MAREKKYRTNNLWGVFAGDKNIQIYTLFPVMISPG
jgi:hypothetical protein